MDISTPTAGVTFFITILIKMNCNENETKTALNYLPQEQIGHTTHGNGSQMSISIQKN
jgi:hypothetical protein